LDLPLHLLFCEGAEPPKNPKQPPAEIAERLWDAKGKESYELVRLLKALSRMNGRKRKLLLGLAHRMAERKRDGANTSR